MNKPFGGGTQRTVRISLGPGNISKVKARVNIFGSRLAVFKSAKLAGQIGVHYWENQLAHVALSRAIDGRRGLRYTRKILLYQVYPDIYSALRRTLHILYGNYGRSFKARGEKSDLSAGLQMLQRVNRYYLTIKSYDADRYQEKIQDQVEASLQKIGFRPRDQKKREARDLLVLVGDILDSLDRINPSAKLARVVAIRNRLVDRVSNILSIEPRIMEQRISLISIIDICELRFRLVEDFLKRLQPNLSASFFSTHGGSDLGIRVAHRLGSLAEDIAPVDLRPFLIPGQRIDEELRATADLIRQGEFETAESAVTIIRESLKLRVLRTYMEHFVTRLTKHLFEPEERLTGAEIRRIKNDFRNIRGRLATIDESGFQRPVCMHALSLVSEAEQPIRHLAVAQNSALGPVKEKLVQAARLI